MILKRSYCYWFAAILFTGTLAILFISAYTNKAQKEEVTKLPDAYLHAPLASKDANLDPSGDWIVDSIDIFNVFYDSLFLISQNGEIQPSIASSLPKISSDGKTYRIKLKENVTFHDDPAFPNGKGRNVKTSDVIYSIKRIADPKNETGLWSLIQDRIEGLNEFRKNLEDSKGKFDDEISGLKAISASELEIKLTKPFPQILNILAMPSLSVVAPEAVAFYGENLKQHAVGTGPFKLKSYSSKEIVAERVKNHWRTPAETKDSTVPDGITFSYFDDSWNAFKNGELDVLYLDSKRLYAYIDDQLQIKKHLAETGYKLYSIKETYRSFVIFNYKNPLFNNIHLRKAIAYAIPWKDLIDKEDSLSASIIPESVAGYVDVKWEYNPTKAAQELVLAGYPQGKNLPEMVFRIRWGTRTQILFAGMIEDALEAVGLPVRVEYKEVDELEDAHMKIQGWVLDYPEASNILGLLHSKNLPPDGNNYGYFQSAEFDSMLDAAYTMNDADRKAQYQKIAQWLYDNVDVIPFRQTQIFYGLSPRVAEIKADPLGYFMWPQVKLTSQNK